MNYTESQQKKVLERIKGNYQPSEILMMEDLKTLFPEIKKECLKSCISKIVQAGNLCRIEKGIYAFPNTSFTDEEIIHEKYVCRKSGYIGYYSGETFLYRNGFTSERPDKIQIISNNASGRHGRNVRIRNTMVRLSQGRTIITHRNEQVLPVLDVLINLRHYGDESDLLQFLSCWMRERGITVTNLRTFSGVYPYYIKNKIDQIGGLLS